MVKRQGWKFNKANQTFKYIGSVRNAKDGSKHDVKNSIKAA